MVTPYQMSTESSPIDPYSFKVQVGYKIMLPDKKEVWTRQTCHATKEKKVKSIV